MKQREEVGVERGKGVWREGGRLFRLDGRSSEEQFSRGDETALRFLRFPVFGRARPAPRCTCAPGGDEWRRGSC